MTEPTRRQFLVGCSAAIFTAALIPDSVLGARLREADLDDISFGAFLQNMNTIFTVRDAAGGRAEVRLVEARMLPQLQQTAAVAEDAGNEKFSLRFMGSPGRAIGQDTYWFEHPRLGRFALFVAPVGPAGTAAANYEAVFNRRPFGGREGMPGLPLPAPAPIAHSTRTK